MKSKLKIAMFQADISQIELATRLNVHPSTMSRIMCGWAVPDPELQDSIKKALGKHGKAIHFGKRSANRQRMAS